MRKSSREHYDRRLRDEPDPHDVLAPFPAEVPRTRWPGRWGWILAPSGAAIWGGACLGDLTAPFMVIPRRRALQRLPRRGGIYDKEPGVIEQFRPGEREAQFEAEWSKQGRRLEIRQARHRCLSIAPLRNQPARPLLARQSKSPGVPGPRGSSFLAWEIWQAFSASRRT
jgi:hypothetical protein